MLAAKRAVCLLCALALCAAGLAGCGGADTLYEAAAPEEEAEVQDCGPDETEPGGTEPGEDENLPVREGWSFDPRDADNYNLVTLNNSVALAGCTAAGGEAGFYQTVLSGDGSACYILYTDYATATTDWLMNEQGAPVKLPADGSEFAVLPAGDTVFLLRLGYTDWGLEYAAGRCGGAVYTMNPDGSGLQLALELDEEMERRIFWPASVAVYDGEGIYCNVAHYNSAKGTADMMLMYIYEDGHQYVEMKYYPMEGESIPLLAGSFGDTMIVRTATGEHFWGPGTVAGYEAGEPLFAYALYHYTSGGLEEPLVGYRNTDTVGIVHQNKLYTVQTGGGFVAYDFSEGTAAEPKFGFPTAPSVEKIPPHAVLTTANSVAVIWGGQFVVGLGEGTVWLDFNDLTGWNSTTRYSPADYGGAVWAEGGGYYVVAASAAEAEASVWPEWPFPEERPAEMRLFLLADADGYWQGAGGHTPLLPAVA